MQHGITHRALALLFFIGGLWACVVSLYLLQLSSLGIYPELGPIAAVLALAMCAAGVIWYFRPVYGMALSIASLFPQALSFAAGNVIYALNFWPNYGVELLIAGAGDGFFSVTTNSFSLSPTWRLSTDASYVGFGIRIEMVSLTAIILLAVAIMVSRRTGNTPPN